jgi:hypothetical protein
MSGTATTNMLAARPAVTPAGESSTTKHRVGPCAGNRRPRCNPSKLVCGSHTHTHTHYIYIYIASIKVSAQHQELNTHIHLLVQHTSRTTPNRRAASRNISGAGLPTCTNGSSPHTITSKCANMGSCRSRFNATAALTDEVASACAESSKTHTHTCRRHDSSHAV